MKFAERILLTTSELGKAPAGPLLLQTREKGHFLFKTRVIARSLFKILRAASTALLHGLSLSSSGFDRVASCILLYLELGRIQEAPQQH